MKAVSRRSLAALQRTYSGGIKAIEALASCSARSLGPPRPPLLTRRRCTGEALLLSLKKILLRLWEGTVKAILRRCALEGETFVAPPPAYVIIRRHTSAYVGKRQDTSAYLGRGKHLMRPLATSV
jgi:hypothetical protein